MFHLICIITHTQHDPQNLFMTNVEHVMSMKYDKVSVFETLRKRAIFKEQKIHLRRIVILRNIEIIVLFCHVAEIWLKHVHAG